jgi:L-asparaginase
VGRIIAHGNSAEITAALERPPPRREHVPTSRIEPRVGYVTAVMGSDATLIEALVDAKACGIVVETIGEGSTTTEMGRAIESAVARGVAVVVASRACGGTYPPTYTDVGESKWLLDRGVLFAGSLSPPKARIKLMFALGASGSASVSEYFPLEP